MIYGLNVNFWVLSGPKHNYLFSLLYELTPMTYPPLICENIYLEKENIG